MPFSNAQKLESVFLVLCCYGDQVFDGERRGTAVIQAETPGYFVQVCVAIFVNLKAQILVMLSNNFG